MITPGEPLHFGHILIKEQLTAACHHQTTEFTLSRPRDFISAVSSGNKAQNFYSSTSLRDQSSSQSQADLCSPGYAPADGSLSSTPCGRGLSAQAEDQSSSLLCSAANSSLMSAVSLHDGDPECRDVCCASSALRDKALDANADTDGKDKKEG